MRLQEQVRFEQIDKAAIAEVILKERMSRDRGRFEKMASCYHLDFHVEEAEVRGSNAALSDASALVREEYAR